MACARAHFDEQERLRPIQQTPHFVKLARQQPAEKRAGVNACEIIAPGMLLRLCVIPVERMIETRIHIFCEGDGTAGTDSLREKQREWRGLAARHHQFTRWGLRVNISMM